MPSFEFDEAKSRGNKKKHGIDFIEAQELWNDADLLEIPARTEREPRWLFIGRIGQRVWSAIVTARGANIRIISVRAARREERDIYEG
jgi:uncharacterized DUF497 family protein